MKKVTVLAAAAAFALTATAPAFAGPWFAKGSYFAGVAGAWNSDVGNEMFDDGTNGDVANGDGIHTRVVTTDQAPGKYEWKAALDDWSVSHPISSNQWVYVNSMGEQITMTLDTNVYADGWIPDTNIAWSSNPWPTGSTPEVIGGAPAIGDWGSGVSAVLVGDIWSVSATFATAGSYEYKWRANGNWDDFVLGNDGAATFGGNLIVDVLNDGDTMTFELNQATGRARVMEENTVSVDATSWSDAKAMYR